MDIETFSQLDKATALNHILHCCHCTRWAEAVLSATPFPSVEALEKTMTLEWAKVSEADLLEAFSAHPKIGDVKVLRDKFAVQAHKEQGQVSSASEETLQALMRCNDEYAAKFGFIFIICASGKSADFMLAELQSRLQNSREQELQNAAAEQHKIMLLRLHQLIEE